MNSVFTIKIAFLQSCQETNKILSHQKRFKATCEQQASLHTPLESMPLRFTARLKLSKASQRSLRLWVAAQKTDLAGFLRLHCGFCQTSYNLDRTKYKNEVKRHNTGRGFVGTKIYTITFSTVDKFDRRVITHLQYWQEKQWNIKRKNPENLHTPATAPISSSFSYSSLGFYAEILFTLFNLLKVPFGLYCFLSYKKPHGRNSHILIPPTLPVDATRCTYSSLHRLKPCGSIIIISQYLILKTKRVDYSAAQSLSVSSLFAFNYTSYYRKPV